VQALNGRVSELVFGESFVQGHDIGVRIPYRLRVGAEITSLDGAYGNGSRCDGQKLATTEPSISSSG
jgi:hypothetical protein